MTSLFRSDEFADKYLVVRLADESCGIAVPGIREILHLRPLVPAPRLPAYVRGTMSLHDRTVPVVDLRLRFALPADFTNHTCIVVVELPLGADSVAELGLIVDAVGDVISATGATVVPFPSASPGLDQRFHIGRVALAGQIVTLLDLGRVAPDECLREFSCEAGPRRLPSASS